MDAEARVYKSWTRLESELLPEQQVQRPTQYSEGILERRGALLLTVRERTLKLESKQNIYYSYVLTSLTVVSEFYFFFLFFSSIAIVVDFISTVKSIYAFDNNFNHNFFHLNTSDPVVFTVLRVFSLF